MGSNMVQSLCPQARFHSSLSKNCLLNIMFCQLCVWTDGHIPNICIFSEIQCFQIGDIVRVFPDVNSCLSPMAARLVNQNQLPDARQLWWQTAYTNTPPRRSLNHFHGKGYGCAYTKAGTFIPNIYLETRWPRALPSPHKLLPDLPR